MVLTDAEDGHDVGVVQPGRRPGLTLEALLGTGIDQELAGQDLQRDMASEGDLLGLVYDPHPAAADLADDPVIAQPPQRGQRAGGRRLGHLLPIFLDLLQVHHGREEFADVVGEVRMAVDVLLKRGTLAAAVPRGELLPESIEQDEPFGAVRGHFNNPPARRASRPGSPRDAATRGSMAWPRPTPGCPARGRSRRSIPPGGEGTDSSSRTVTSRSASGMTFETSTRACG